MGQYWGAGGGGQSTSIPTTRDAPANIFASTAAGSTTAAATSTNAATTNKTTINRVHRVDLRPLDSTGAGRGHIWMIGGVGGPVIASLAEKQLEDITSGYCEEASKVGSNVL